MSIRIDRYSRQVKQHTYNSSEPFHVLLVLLQLLMDFRVPLLLCRIYEDLTVTPFLLGKERKSVSEEDIFEGFVNCEI